MPKVLPQYKRDARNRIVETALQIFSEKGYHEATMDDVAQRLGVSKGALYLYFKSKEELFKVCCDAGPKVLQDLLRSSFGGSDLLKNARDFFDRMAEQSVWTPPLSFEVLAEASRNKSLRDTVKENYEKIIGEVREFLEELRKRGLIREEVKILPLARGLIALYDGLIADFAIGIEKSDIREAWTESIGAMAFGVFRKSS